MTVELKFKSKSGQISSIHVEELIAVDGVPYRGGTDELRDSLIHVAGRLDAIENIIGLRGSDNGGN